MYLAIYLSTNLPIYISTYLPIYVSIYLSIYLSVYLSIYPSIYLSIYLSVFCTFRLRNVNRATTACNLSSLIWPDGGKFVKSWTQHFTDLPNLPWPEERRNLPIYRFTKFTIARGAAKFTNLLIYQIYHCPESVLSLASCLTQ